MNSEKSGTFSSRIEKILNQDAPLSIEDQTIFLNAISSLLEIQNAESGPLDES